MLKVFAVATLTMAFCFSSFAQTETLTNNEIVLMTQAGLSKSLIVKKIRDSIGDFDTTVQGLIDLKKAWVSDDVITLLLDKLSDSKEKPYSESTSEYSENDQTFNRSNSQNFDSNSRIVLKPKEAILTAKTIAIKKPSLHPSRQALEKELFKRKEWESLNLNIVRYKEDADLLIEIGYVSMSWITHRYVYRIYDNKSGTIIAAGETTSWGSLSENLARGIAKRLKKALTN